MSFRYLRIFLLKQHWIVYRKDGGFISANCDIPKAEFLLAIKFVLNSTFFTFNKVIYQQTFRTPMGSPLSPIIADIVLQDLENKALSTLSFTPSFYFRYVDDVALAVPSELIEYTLNIFNSFHARLQFTVEIGLNNSLNFLDITMLLDNKRIVYDWYHKETFSGRYLNFLSQSFMSEKGHGYRSLRYSIFIISSCVSLKKHQSHYTDSTS